MLHWAVYMAAAASKDGENFSILHSTKQSSTKKKDKSSSCHSFTDPILVKLLYYYIHCKQCCITHLFIRMSCLKKSSHEHVWSRHRQVELQDIHHQFLLLAHVWLDAFLEIKGKQKKEKERRSVNWLTISKTSSLVYALSVIRIKSSTVGTETSSYLQAISIAVTPTNWSFFLITAWRSKNLSMRLTVRNNVSSKSSNL